VLNVSRRLKLKVELVNEIVHISKSVLYSKKIFPGSSPKEDLIKFISRSIMAKNQHFRNGSVPSVPSSDSNFKQLSFRFRPPEPILTTKQVLERYTNHFSVSELKNCKIQEFREFPNGVLLHIGHNQWKVWEAKD
ncbi:MAG: hypothetical protein ACRCU2_32880, partial [Planktothrix sp.]